MRKLATPHVLLAALLLVAAGCGSTGTSNVGSTTPVSASAVSTVPWNEASSHVGETVTVEGPMAGTNFAESSNGSPTFLDVGAAYPDPSRFSVVIWGENRGNFPSPPEDYYAGKTIRVTGTVVDYQGVSQIEVSSPDSIQVVEYSPSPTATTPAATGSLTSKRLMVHVLFTQQGANGQLPTYPASVIVQVPAVLSDEVAAYGVAGVVLLAPAGWTAEHALIAADGSRVATLRASSTAAIPGRVFFESEQETDWFEIASGTAVYFPWAREQWLKFGLGSSPPPARAGLVEHFDGTQLARYSVTSGAEVKKGLQVTGVARTSLAPNDLSNRGFDNLEVALPPRDHALATAMIDYYLASH